MLSLAGQPPGDSRWPQPMMAYFGCFVPMCWAVNQAGPRRTAKFPGTLQCG